jgi:hypothetical protein
MVGNIVDGLHGVGIGFLVVICSAQCRRPTRLGPSQNRAGESLKPEDQLETIRLKRE